MSYTSYSRYAATEERWNRYKSRKKQLTEQKDARIAELNDALQTLDKAEKDKMHRRNWISLLITGILAITIIVVGGHIWYDLGSDLFFAVLLGYIAFNAVEMFVSVGLATSGKAMEARNKIQKQFKETETKFKEDMSNLESEFPDFQ